MSKKVLMAALRHETNTFSALPTDLAAFEDRSVYRWEEVARAHRGTKVEMAAFLDMAEQCGWEAVHPVSANATPSGKVTEAAFETYCGEILAAIDSHGPFDAILLALHGAMVTTHSDDGEGLLLERIRAKVGPDVPIGMPLDLHANVTDRMVRHADVVISYRTYPHIDGYETGEAVAECIRDMLDGGPRLVSVVARGAMLDGVDHGRTTSPGPMREVLAIADGIAEADPAVRTITVNAGFAWADIPDAGPSAVVVGTGDRAHLRRIAEGLVQEIWDRRHEVTIHPLTAAEAMQRIAELPAGEGAVVLADFADNPGGGGYGDATGLLRAMIGADLRDAAFASIADPEAVRACAAAGIGASVTIELGGKIDPGYGPPIPVTGRVAALSDGRFRLEGPMAQGAQVTLGQTALLTVGGIDIVVTAGRGQALDRQYFRHLGVDPERKAVLAVKSAQHFRAAFAPLAREIIVVDDGDGLTSRDYKRRDYRRLRRPIFPLDLD